MTQPVLYGSNRKKSINPSNNYPLWTIEQELEKSKTGRKFNVIPIDRIGNSRMSADETNDSPYSTLDSGRGLKPEELIDERGMNRRNSNLLRKSLKNSSHSQFSVWPSSQSRNRSDSIGGEQRVRRRTLYNTKLEPHLESTGF